LLLLEEVEALLNLPQSHFDGASLLKRDVRLREPKKMNCTPFYNFCHQEVTEQNKTAPPLTHNGQLLNLRERIKTIFLING